MKQVYTRTKQAFIALSLLLLLTATTVQAQICGPIVEDFQNTGGTTAGFTGDFTLGTSGSGSTQRRFLEKRQPIAGAIYTVTTPTYFLPSNQSAVGYGFLLDGSEKVARVEASIIYVSSLNGQITTFFLGQFVPTYNTNNQDADVCRAVSINEIPGFTAGSNYRFRFEFTPNTGSGGVNTNITFDDFRTNGTIANSPLPVHFISLVGKKSTIGVNLIWKVAGEENVNRYEIERSLDGRSFTTIGTVAAGKKDTYNYTDTYNNNTTIYYRIKNVDNDGKFKYSSVARLENGRMNIVLKAFPQPAITSITVQHPETKGQGLINISTVDGRIVRSIKVTTGSNQTFVDMNNLQKGMYLVRFDDGEGSTETMKIIKQ